MKEASSWFFNIKAGYLTPLENSWHVKAGEDSLISWKILLLGVHLWNISGHTVLYSSVKWLESPKISKFFKSFCATFQLWMNVFLNNSSIYSTLVWNLFFSVKTYANICRTFFSSILINLSNGFLLVALVGDKVHSMRPLAIGVDITSAVVVVSATLFCDEVTTCTQSRQLSLLSASIAGWFWRPPHSQLTRP